MALKQLAKKASGYLDRLCVEIPNRRVGSEGNRAATDLFAEAMDSLGAPTERQEFQCIDWMDEGARLEVAGEPFEVRPSPYSLGCRLVAPLAVVSTVAELETVDVAQKLLLVRGELAREQLMPKDFPFYNPDEHRRIVHLLETKAPLGIIAATSRNPELAAALYPFPLIEDGDFDIPSVYTTEETGNRLRLRAGAEATLASSARRLPTVGSNVVARRGIDSNRRIVLCAHIDAKLETPGALDNAAGVVVLLLLAELLRDAEPELSIEFLAINGEEHYASPGEIEYLRVNRDRLRDIVLAVNLDAVGYYEGHSAYSLYSCPDEMASLIRDAFAGQPDLIEGESWNQSDHMIFVQNEVPALAITSERFAELYAEVAHTPKDVPELVDPTKLARTALALQVLLSHLEGALC